MEKEREGKRESERGREKEEKIARKRREGGLHLPFHCLPIVERSGVT